MIAGIVGVPLLFWTHRALGQNLSAILHTRQEQTPVTGGPYRWVRHPMYTAIALLVVACGLPAANWLIGLAGLGGFSLIIARRVGQEEAVVIEQFGDRYRD